MTYTRFTNLYATDGRCHNSEPGTFNHECGAPATRIGVDRRGFASGYCERCAVHGHEAQDVIEWHPIPAAATTSPATNQPNPETKP